MATEYALASIILLASSVAVASVLIACRLARRSNWVATWWDGLD